MTDHSITLLAELAGETSPGVSSGTEQRTAGGSVDLAELDEWQQSGRMPVCERGPAPAETSDKAWKLALDSLRERTVRR